MTTMAKEFIIHSSTDRIKEMAYSMRSSTSSGSVEQYRQHAKLIADELLSGLARLRDAGYDAESVSTTIEGILDSAMVAADSDAGKPEVSKSSHNVTDIK